VLRWNYQQLAPATSGLTLPDGSGRTLRLRLTRKEQISVHIDHSTDALLVRHRNSMIVTTRPLVPQFGNRDESFARSR
jgi:hypothetical protein